MNEHFHRLFIVATLSMAFDRTASFLVPTVKTCTLSTSAAMLESPARTIATSFTAGAWE